ncbi:MAG: hypothetical protein ACR2FE_07385 [Aeromicrobium sp.]
MTGVVDSLDTLADTLRAPAWIGDAHGKLLVRLSEEYPSTGKTALA